MGDHAGGHEHDGDAQRRDADREELRHEEGGGHDERRDGDPGLGSEIHGGMVVDGRAGVRGRSAKPPRPRGVRPPANRSFIRSLGATPPDGRNCRSADPPPSIPNADPHHAQPDPPAPRRPPAHPGRGLRRRRGRPGGDPGNPPADLTYATSPAHYDAESAIAPNVASWSGGDPTSFTIVPALPEGLALDGATGVISGTTTKRLGPTRTYTHHGRERGRDDFGRPGAHRGRARGARRRLRRRDRGQRAGAAGQVRARTGRSHLLQRARHRGHPRAPRGRDASRRAVRRERRGHGPAPGAPRHRRAIRTSSRTAGSTCWRARPGWA